MDVVLTNEYSVWLEPSAPGALGDLITEFARRAGTPNFLPHVTLMPGLVGDEQELVERTQKLAGAGAISMTLGDVTTGDAYHKCFYLECDTSVALLQLRTRSEDIFSTTGSYHPHASLAYGLSDPEHIRAFLAELEGKKFTMTVDRVSLWLARGRVEEWRRVAEFPL